MSKFKVGDRVKYIGPRTTDAKFYVGNIRRGFADQDGPAYEITRDIPTDRGGDYFIAHEFNLIKEDNMDEKARFEATMKKIDGAKVCDEYKDFARDIVRGIFGEEKKEEWKDITQEVEFDRMGSTHKVAFLMKHNGYHFGWLDIRGAYICKTDADTYRVEPYVMDKDMFVIHKKVK